MGYWYKHLPSCFCPPNKEDTLKWHSNWGKAIELHPRLVPPVPRRSGEIIDGFCPRCGKQLVELASWDRGPGMSYRKTSEDVTVSHSKPIHKPRPTVRERDNFETFTQGGAPPHPGGLLIDKGADIVTLSEEEAKAYERAKTSFYHAQGVLIPRMVRRTVAGEKVLNHSEIDAFNLLGQAAQDIDKFYAKRWGLGNTMPYYAIAKMRWERDTKLCEPCQMRYHVPSGSYERHLSQHPSARTTTDSSPKPSGNFLRRWLLSAGSRLMNSFVDL
jgi:hypothetical protein